MNVNLPLPWGKNDVRQNFFDDFIGGFLAGPEQPEGAVGMIRVGYIFNFSICEDFF